MAATQTISFLDLPPEVRNKIYAYYLSTPNIVISWPYRKGGHSHQRLRIAEDHHIKYWKPYWKEARDYKQLHMAKIDPIAFQEDLNQMKFSCRQLFAETSELLPQAFGLIICSAARPLDDGITMG
jgi:hypothetical protein